MLRFVFVASLLGAVMSSMSVGLGEMPAPVGAPLALLSLTVGVAVLMVAQWRGRWSRRDAALEEGDGREAYERPEITYRKAA